MSAPLNILLFGGFDVSVHGKPLRKLRTRQGGRLLALLALGEGRELQRATLAGQLWLESSADDRALGSLRRALTDLRNALGPEEARLESVGNFALRLNLSGGATCDVHEFDRAIAARTPDGLDRAIDLYRGPLMPDLDAIHDPDGVLHNERERRHVAFLNALQRRADRRRAGGETEAALADFRRLLAAEAVRESASRAVMELLADSDDRAGAIAEYQRLCRALSKELGTRPEAETRALYERIQTGGLKPTVSRVAAVHHNLPTRLTRFIGQEAAAAEVRTLLHDNRLLTITGTGGAGKTRLAQEVAAGALDLYPDGVWEIELAPLSASEPALVARTIATTLGVKDMSGQTPLQSLVLHLQGKRLLLLLDNCEHLLDACAQLADAILTGCEHVTILATSREPLALFGEQSYRIPSLTLPEEPRGGPLTAATLTGYEAVRLFVDRAALASPGFAVTDRNAPTVALLCRQLDGIPLALELAAARMRALPLEQIAARLEDRFGFLTVGDRRAQPRQKTLRSLIDWSYDLLSENERTLFARLSVFSGGWTHDAAETVGGFGSLHETAVLNQLTGLVDKSLVVVEQAEDHSVRYRLLETIRQYAGEKRDGSGETESLQERHRKWCLALAETAQLDCNGPKQGFWLNRLEAEHNNFRAALDGCAAAVASGAAVNEALAETGLRLAAALGWFWVVHGHFSEGRDALTRATQIWTHVEAAAHAGNVDYRRPPVTSATLAMAYHRYGQLAMNQGDYRAARQSTEESLSLRREIGDKAGIAVDLVNLGAVAQRQGYPSDARAFYSECLALNREVGDESSTQIALRNLADISRSEGDFAMARNLIENALTICRRLNDDRAIAATLVLLGNINFSEGNWEDARSFCEESLLLHRTLGDKGGIAWSLVNLGVALGHLGDREKAWALCKESVALRRELGDISGVGQALRHLATIAKQRGELAVAQELSQESLTLLRAVGDKLKLGMALLGSGDIARLSGDEMAAVRLLREGLVLLRDLGAKLGIILAIQCMATICATGGDSSRAAILWGAADALRAGNPFRLPTTEQSDLDVISAHARAAIGEAEFAALWDIGRSMDWEQAVAYALGESDAADHASNVAAPVA